MSLSKFPTDATPEVKLFNELEVVTRDAKTSHRVPYIYVDLTAEDLLPIWLPPESSSGGKTTLHHEEIDRLDSTASISIVQELAATFKKATSNQGCSAV